MRGGSVTAVAQIAKFGLRFGSTAVLARLLTPEDYGLIAMTALVIGFVGVINDAGLSSSVIQRRVLSHAQVSTIFWINVLLGLVLAVAVAASGKWVAWFFGEPRLVGVVMAMSVSFVFSGLSVQHTALLRRNMRFRVLAVIEIVSLVVGILVAVVMALFGSRYWSLVGMTVASSLTNLVCVWVACSWRPGLPRRGAGVRSMLKFGADILVFNSVNFFSRNGDNLLIGWYWGAGSLGLYDKAYSLLLMPVQQINAPIAAVAVPALARCQSKLDELKQYYLSMYRVIASLSIPVIFAVALFAPEIVLLWLGPKWAECAELFQLLAPAALIGALLNPSGWLLIALGKTKRYRNLGIAGSILVVVSFVLGLPYGTHGVALAYSIQSVVLFVPIWGVVLRGTGIELRVFLANIWHPVASSVVAALSAGATKVLLPAAMSDLLVAVLGGTVFGLVYAIVLLVFFEEIGLLNKIVRELRAPTKKPKGQG